MGQLRASVVLGYNAARRPIPGTASTTWAGRVAAETLSGKTWTYTGDADMGGKIYKSRYVITETSPMAYTFSMDFSEDGKSWNKVMEGTVTKK